jgi:hypothetical protein
MSHPETANSSCNAQSATIAIRFRAGLARNPLSPMGGPERPAPLRTFPIHVDGQRVGGVRYADSTTNTLPAGPHSVSVKADWWASDIIRLDLQPGEHVRLVCGYKDLVQGRFFKAIEGKFLYFVLPFALVAYVSKDVVHFIERHLRVEFLAVVFLFCLGILLGLPRLFSRKPGAMLSLAWDEAEDASRTRTR